MDEPNLNTAEEIALREATERLRSVFGEYEKPPVESCVDTMGGPIPDDARVAWAKSPWDYRPEDMEFIFHSFCQFFNPPDGHEIFVRTLKFWLPRLLYGMSKGEIALVMNDWFISEQLVRATWLEWPAEEVEAVKQWFFAWLRACIACCDDERRWKVGFGWRSPGGCVDCALDVGLDLTKTLYDLPSTLERREVWAMNDIVTSFANDAIRRDKLDVEGHAALARRALLKWMLHRSTSGRLEKAFFRAADTDQELASTISETSAWIEIVRKSYIADWRGVPQWLNLRQ